MTDSRGGQIGFGVGILLVCCVMGLLASTELLPPLVIVVLAAAGTAVYVLSLPRYRHLLRVEAPFGLLFLAIAQWRTRDLTASTNSPIDAAVVVAVMLQGAALALAISSLGRPARGRWSGTNVPILCMAGFASVAMIAVPLAVKPSLAAYQAFEVAIALVVLFAAVRSVPDAAPRLARIAFLATVVFVCVIWLGAVIKPAKAFDTVTEVQGGISSPIHVRLHGVFPATNSDTVGIYGSILFLWSLGLALAAPKGEKGRFGALCVLGLLTLLISQYRTGYVMVVVGGLALLALTATRRPGAALVATGLALMASIAVLLAAGSQLDQVQEGLISRGQNQQQTSNVNGRRQIWEGDIKIWEASPIVGHGLSSATRYEVIGPAGGALNQAHSSWFEALASTGTIGTILLLIAVTATGVDLLRRRFVIPAVLWAALVILSITSIALSSMSYGFLIYILLIACGSDATLARSSAGEMLGSVRSLQPTASLGAPVTPTARHVSG